MKKFFKTIAEVPPEIVKAYDEHRYSFSGTMLPCQAHSMWNKVAWINYVQFSSELEALRSVPAPAEGEKK